MTTLHVGVLETFHGKITTADLADILEKKYALFSQFVDLEFDAIEEAITNEVEAKIHALINGLPVPDEFREAGSVITKLFMRYLDTEEIVKSGVPGVPTQAALDGRNSRLKNRKGARRPSFIDTSVLRASLVAWVETDGNTA